MPRSPETHCSMRKARAAWDLFDHEAMLDELMGTLEYRSFDCPSYVAPRMYPQMHETLAPAVPLEKSESRQ